MKLFFTKLILGTAFLGTAFSVAAQEAAIGSTEYATLAEAFAAAQKNDVIDLLKDVDCKTALEINNDMTFNLNGHTITNNVANSRFFRLGDAKFTIEGKGGAITTPESNTKSYGLVDFQNMSGAASASASLVAKDLTVSGDTDEGSMFRLRSSGQSIELDNCNVTMAGKTNNFSVINGYRLTDIKMTVNGGVYDYSSANKSAGMFQAGVNSTVAFSGAKLTCDGGPVYECVGADATFTDCNVTNNTSTTPSYLNACLAASNGGKVTVDGGSFTGDIGMHIYNSGGNMTIDGNPTITGTTAALEVDNTTTANESSMTVNGGTVNGPLVVGTKSELAINEGTFTASNAPQYFTDNAQSVATTDAAGNTVYVAVPSDTEYVAMVGTNGYASLDDALAAAKSGDTLTLLKDVECTEAIEVNQDLTFCLNGHSITNNVANSRLFRLGDAKLTIEGKGGAITTPESNTKSYGLVDFQNMSGAASASASLVAKDLTVSGDTDEGSMFRLRSSGQSIELDNCNVTMAGKTNNFSVINGYRLTDIKMTVNGGVYDYSSANKSAGMFQAGANSTVTFSGATLTCDGGPVYECVGADATFTDCNVTNNTSTTPSYLNACLAVSNGGEITIDGGSYTGDTALYVYNSGGSMVVEDGTFTGAANAIQVDATSTATSHVEVNGGTFNGGIKVAEGDNADLQISGGNFDAPNVGDYCVDGFEPVLGEDGRYQVEGISTSVTEIAVPGQNIKHNGVYNLSGLRVAETVEGLQPGIYVVGGKKVYVK